MKEFDPRTLQQQIISAPTRQQSSHFLQVPLERDVPAERGTLEVLPMKSHRTPTDFMSYFWPILSKLF